MPGQMPGGGGMPWMQGGMPGLGQMHGGAGGAGMPDPAAMMKQMQEM
jgi:hypothetical protein